jgi:Tfp pilus assembly protein PilF
MLLLQSEVMRTTLLQGMLFLRKDSLKEAKEQLNQLLKIELKSGLVHFCLGLIAQKQNQIREANQHFSIAESLGYEKARELLNHNSEAKFYNSLMQFCDLT